ncbi:phosphatidate cytidylyltransferase [Marinifilum sp.]|uniref:phosphatidate cytidylyltransferase n=1 Tax=Marinifilum sp. TaxID=2033137 RepID=UPI003BA8AD57
MRNFLTRALFGLIFVVVLVTGIVIHPISFFVIFLGITLLASYEFYKLIQKHDCVPQITTGLIGAALLFTSCFVYKYFNNSSLFALFVPSLVVIPIFEMYRKKENPFGNIAYTFMGILYIALPFSLLNFLAFPFQDNEFHWEILMGVFVLIWANDTGAYLVGINLGKHRLFERISPKKSWEGSIGGAIITIAIAYLISLYTKDLTTIEWIITGAIVVAFGSMGDLVESLLKRSINIKDSGTIIPGHGGLLDRFDALLLVSPMIFVFLQVINEFFR